jgi:hypothetical protein
MQTVTTPDAASHFFSSTRRIQGELEEAIGGIRRTVLMQLLGMARWITDQECRDCLRSLAVRMDTQLRIISKLGTSGEIQPFRRILLAEDGDPIPVSERPLRIGFYPLAANPMHWGHILVGLSALLCMKLDKVVFVIAGTDNRKPWLLSAETRHRMGRAVIETFNPLFAYSPVALGTSVDGETNFGRLLWLNQHQAMEAFYIAGLDHYRRTTPQDQVDTIQKLERVAGEHAGTRRHSIAAVFIDRKGTSGERGDIDTFLRVHVLPPVPFSFSSTAARRALCSETFSRDLMSLPYSCLLQIRMSALYTGRGECSEDEHEPDNDRSTRSGTHERSRPDEP